jgi:MSHA pilin protein MshA
MKKLSNNSFSKQKGFTLIELVVVIVILGILAATAAPKFIDLTTDARSSVMKGVLGSINSAVNLAHAKALVAASQTEIESSGTFYTLVNGFPATIGAGDADGTEGAGRGIDGLIELDSGSPIVFKDFVIAGTDATENEDGSLNDDAVADADVTGFVHTGATDETKCSLAYANAATSETPPVITSDFSGC